MARLVYNTQESGTISPRGTLIRIAAGELFHTTDSRDAPTVQLALDRTFPLPTGILGFSVNANTYFRRNVTEPLRFTLGGPFRLSASSIDEYRGTDDYLVRGAYLHRLFSLPTGVGEGLYASFGYEAGEMWSPERPAFLRQDGLLTGLASTPIGVIQFGGAVGDAGRRKFFFSYGRVFLSRISRSRGWFGALVLVCGLVGGGVATVPAQQQVQMAELFSSFMQKYSETPAFREKVLDVSRSVPKVGELLTPDMVRDLRALILGKHWQRVDRFPGFTIGTLNHSVALTMHVAGTASKPLTVAALVDVGAYAPGKAGMVDLDQAAAGPSYEQDPQTAVTQLAPGIVMGDGPDPALAPMHAQSLRLAEALNRLALNVSGKPQFTVRLRAASYTDAGALIKALAASGEQVQVDDDLYFRELRPPA